MKTRQVIGIDPGVEGAIVILTLNGKISSAHNIPVIETEKPKAKKKPKKDAPAAKKPKKESLVTITKTVDFAGVRSILKPYLYACLVQDQAEVYVEEITHLFGLPSSTNYKLGHAVGVIHSAVQSYTDEFYLVPIKKWQAGVWDESDMVYKPNKRVDTKATSKNAFKRIFPDYDGINSDGVRDAALIAWFARTGGL